MLIHTKSHPRAGLIGNPSDGYFGKTIALVFRNYAAEVILYQTPEIEILSNTRDNSKFDSIGKLAEDVRLFGYYGGIRLLKATIKRFHDYCAEHAIELDDRNFTIRYHTNIPSQVGLAGSSAIITACLRALMAFYSISIPKAIQPNLILSVEKNELGIPAGLQDRVAQVYEGLVYMNFAKDIMDRQGHGDYEELDIGLLPNIYLAFREDLSEDSGVFHNGIRSRFDCGDTQVIEAMKYWASLAEQARNCLVERRIEAIPALLNANFDMRRKIYRISPGNLLMVDTARSVGASAKFTGSGGAIIGTYEDEPMFKCLVEALGAIRVKVIKPIITPQEKNPS